MEVSLAGEHAQCDIWGGNSSSECAPLCSMIYNCDVCLTTTRSCEWCNEECSAKNTTLVTVNSTCVASCPVTPIRQVINKEKSQEQSNAGFISVLIIAALSVVGVVIYYKRHT